MQRKRSLWSILCISITIACGILALADHMLVHPQMSKLNGILLEGVMILAAFGLLLGIINLLTSHTQRLISRTPLSLSPDGSVTHHSRLSSAILIPSLLGTLVLGLVAPASAGMTWLFEYVYYPIQATLAALLAFAIVQALFRAYQLRSLDAVLLLVGSVGMLILQTPWASMIWSEMSLVGEWVMTVPVTAIVRGLLIGSSLGALSTALRVLAAVDRPYLGE